MGNTPLLRTAPPGEQYTHHLIVKNMNGQKQCDGLGALKLVRMSPVHHHTAIAGCTTANPQHARLLRCQCSKLRAHKREQ